MTQDFTNVDEALPVLTQKVLETGEEVGSRLGERTMELLHQQIVIQEPWQREVLTPYRNTNIAAQIAETMWVLAGRDDVEFLGRYLPRARDFSDDGKVWRGAYGPRLRDWGQPGEPRLDQIRHIVNLLSTDRASRRAVVSIYNPLVDSAPGKDIPCNDFLSFISRQGRLHLSVFVRSNDLIWGWSGINAFEWSALQEIVAGILGLQVGPLVFNTTSLHIYDRHWDKARKIQEHAHLVQPAWQDSPRFEMYDYPGRPAHQVTALDELIDQWFDIEKRLRERAFLEGDADQIISHFPEPMMRSWLRVLAWYWSGEGRFLKPLEDTRLYAATLELPKGIALQVAGRKPPPVEITITADTSGLTQALEKVAVYSSGVIEPLAHKMTFLAFVDSLHRAKSAAYGDSWKKRGELFSIIPNIARKVDRLEGGKSTEDEVIADTAIDLLVYLIKYRLWLGEQHPEFKTSYSKEYDENARLTTVLNDLHVTCTLSPKPDAMPFYVTSLVKYFERLQTTVSNDPHRKLPRDRVAYVNQMMTWSFLLARYLWEQEQGEATGSYVSQ